MDLPDETDDDVPRQSPDYRQRCSPSERSTTKLRKRRIRADCVNPRLAGILCGWARISPARPPGSSGAGGILSVELGSLLSLTSHRSLIQGPETAAQPSRREVRENAV